VTAATVAVVAADRQTSVATSTTRTSSAGAPKTPPVRDEVAVDVGGGSDGLAFTPAAVHVDNGATVIWEWTGEGAGHNVVSNDDEFESGDPVGEAGTTFEYTFEEDGVYNYHCVPTRVSA